MSKLKRNDDYTRMKKFIDEMKKKQRKARQRIIKDIGKNVIKNFRVPKYETYSKGPNKDEYKLDQHGKKIRKTHHTRSGKTIKDTRKLVSFKDFVDNFKIIPKDADDNSNLLKLNDEKFKQDQQQNNDDSDKASRNNNDQTNSGNSDDNNFNPDSV